MPIAQHLETIARASLQVLDALSRATWADFGAGKISEAEASAITEAIEARRKALRRPVQGQTPLRVAVIRDEGNRAPAGNVAGPCARARAPARGPRQLVLRIPRPATYDRARSRER